MSRNTERDLLDNLESSIKERIEYGISSGEYKDMTREEISDDISDESGEIIDGCLPIYYYDMAQLLASNTNFASVDDEGLLPENPTVWDIITMSVSEWLSGEFYTTLESILDDLMPEDE